MGANLNSPVNLPARSAQPVSQPAANAPAANTPAANAAAPAVEQTAAPAAADHKGGNQIMGFFEGFVKEGVDTVGGLYTLVTTNPITTAKGLVYMASHPIKTGQAIVEPYTTALKEGHYGEFAGRLSFQALTFVVTSGALAKGEKGASVGSKAAAETSGKGVAEATGKGAAAAAKSGSAAATKVSLSATQAEEAGFQKATAEMLAKHPKLTADALKDMLANNNGNVILRNQAKALAAKYTAEAGGVATETLDSLMKVAGHLPKGDVYKYIGSATGAGMSEAEISANLAKFAGEQGGKEAMRAAVKGFGAAATAAPATEAAAKVAQTEAKTVGQALDDSIAGVKNTVGSVKGAVNSAVDSVKGAGETLGQAYKKTAQGLDHGVQAVKGVYDASFTLGDVAHGVAEVPLAIGRGVGSLYNHTIGKLIDSIANIRLVNPFHLPNFEELANVKIRPGHILLSPITVPLGLTKGALSLAIHNPVRFMGVAALAGDVGIVAKKGELVAARPEDPTPDPVSSTDGPSSAPTSAGFREYALKEGDTLESIAQKELGATSDADVKRIANAIYVANQDLFDSMGPDGVVPSGTKIKLPTGGAAADPATSASNEPAAAGAAAKYKAALLKLIDEKAAGTDGDTKKVLEGLKQRLAAMTPEEVLKLKPQLEEQGLKVTVAPAADTPAATPNGTAAVKPAPAPVAPAAPARPAAPPAPGATPGQYTVQRNDSLWSIAQSQLGDAAKWRDLVKLNKDTYPSLETNPDFIQVGWKLSTAAAAKAPLTTPALTPAAKAPAATAPAPNAAPASAAAKQPSPEQRQQIIKQFGLETTDDNWNNFWTEVSAYPGSTIGPDTGTETDRKNVQTILGKLGFPVQATGNYYTPGADGKPKLDASGNPVSPTADAIIAFKKMAGITQSYNVVGADGKSAPDVNEYVDTRTRETMQVTLRLLQNPGVRSRANMEAAVHEAANLQDSSIGPDVGSREGRALVQQNLAALGKTGVKPTGTFDDATINALIEFKKANNLSASYKDDKGQPIYTPYVDGPTAEALYQATQNLTTK